jgi:hypothetical protein
VTSRVIVQSFMRVKSFCLRSHHPALFHHLCNYTVFSGLCNCTAHSEKTPVAQPISKITTYHGRAHGESCQAGRTEEHRAWLVQELLHFYVETHNSLFLAFLKVTNFSDPWNTAPKVRSYDQKALKAPAVAKCFPVPTSVSISAVASISWLFFSRAGTPSPFSLPRTACLHCLQPSSPNLLSTTYQSIRTHKRRNSRE